MRFGRLVGTSARGSTLVPLLLRLELQYWNGTAFITNTADTCTTIAANNIEMTNFSQNLDLCETSLTVAAFSKGRAIAQLSKPGGANTGSVTLVPRLGSSVVGAQTCIAGGATAVTGANLQHLQGKWDAVDQNADDQFYDDNPAVRGTFGVYPGSGGVIDFRENF
jgi:MSHA biogenesis protein MshQ